MTVGERKREILIARAFADKNFAVPIRACHLGPAMPASNTIRYGQPAAQNL
jgi:hypothetical protein